MSISSINAQNFYKEVAKHKKIYIIKDKTGYPFPKNTEGKRTVPVWSLRSRVEKVISEVPFYKNFEIVELSLEEFKNKWVPGLHDDNFLIGINWYSKNLTGYDLNIDDFLKNLSYYI